MNWTEELRGFGAEWDQGRRDQSVPGRVLDIDEVGITSEFEGGNGFDMQRIGPDHYFVRCEPDPGEHRFSGKSYYFCFAVQNRRPIQRRITIRVEAAGWSYFGLQTQHYVVRRGDSWRVCGAGSCRPVRADGELDTVDLDILLPGGTERDTIIVVSNFHWNRHQELVAWMDGLRSGTARCIEIGTSYDGLPIRAVEVGRTEAAPCLLLAQTSQPSELVSTLVIRAMVEHLCADNARAREMRETIRFCFLPMTNPDGQRLGLTVSNRNGHFPVFEGDRAVKGLPDTSKEAEVLWSYLSANRPAIYWEWHSNNWSRRPGHMVLRYRDSLIGDAARRRDWVELEDALLRLPDTYHENFTDHTAGHYQPTMGFQAAVELGSISTMIKTHEKYPVDASLSHGISCLELAARQLMKG